MDSPKPRRNVLQLVHTRYISLSFVGEPFTHGEKFDLFMYLVGVSGRTQAYFSCYDGVQHHQAVPGESSRPSAGVKTGHTYIQYN